jgi:methylenetetrahydrofolate dehydrogenase (NADP+) / methenyltetrahydrofolate cyclohydrolase
VNVRIIDGKAVAHEAARRIPAAGGQPACRARHLRRDSRSSSLGSNPASRLYVSNKVRACEEVGIRSERIEFPADVDEGRLLGEIDRLNADATVHGILVQLPAHIAMRRILERISVSKDRRRLPPYITSAAS